MDLNTILNDLEITMEEFNKFRLRWRLNYNHLIDYYNQNGNINIPTDYIANGTELGKWLKNQRRAYSENRLSDSKIKLLNKLNMRWNKQNLKWEIYYNLLAEYKKEYGNIDIPEDYMVEKAKLGKWLKNQRNYYNDKRLSDIQIQLLNEIDINWNKKDIKWEVYYNLLVKYKKEHGNIDVSSNYEVDGYKLGSWLQTQRKAYRNICNLKPLSDTQIKKLNDLGIKWKINNKQNLKWQDYYNLLKDYYLSNGNTKLPRNYEINGIKLWEWLNNQRRAYRKNDNHKLNDRQISLLNEINIDWSPNDTKYLNQEITDYNKYQEIMLKRIKNILEDLSSEEKEAINKTELEKILVKKIWR